VGTTTKSPALLQLVRRGAVTTPTVSAAVDPQGAKAGASPATQNNVKVVYTPLVAEGLP
jgi:hypothetical protein